MASLAGRDQYRELRDGISMPSLFRFLFVVSMLFAVSYGSLYVLAVYFEPEQSEVQKPLPTVKIRR